MLQPFKKQALKVSVVSFYPYEFYDLVFYSFHRCDSEVEN